MLKITEIHAAMHACKINIDVVNSTNITSLHGDYRKSQIPPKENTWHKTQILCRFTIQCHIIIMAT